MRTINVLYLARYKEAFECPGERLLLRDDILNAGHLIAFLAQRGGIWKDEFTPNPRLKIAINMNLANESTAIMDGDEVAFFPPVTGG